MNVFGSSENHCNVNFKLYWDNKVKGHWIEKSNIEKLEKSKFHPFKPPCTSLTLQSNSMQLPEPSSAMTYKGVKRTQGEGCWTFQRSRWTLGGWAHGAQQWVCRLPGGGIVCCNCCVMHVFWFQTKFASEPKWHLTPNRSQKQTQW